MVTVGEARLNPDGSLYDPYKNGPVAEKFIARFTYQSFPNCCGFSIIYNLCGSGPPKLWNQLFQDYVMVGYKTPLMMVIPIEKGWADRGGVGGPGRAYETLRKITHLFGTTRNTAHDSILETRLWLWPDQTKDGVNYALDVKREVFPLETNKT